MLAFSYTHQATVADSLRLPQTGSLPAWQTEAQTKEGRKRTLVALDFGKPGQFQASYR
jgi:hypothetical protein